MCLKNFKKAIIFLAVSIFFLYHADSVLAVWTVSSEACDLGSCSGYCECKIKNWGETKIFVTNKTDLVVNKWTEGSNWELFLKVLTVENKACNVVAVQREQDTKTVEDSTADNPGLFTCKYVAAVQKCCCADLAEGKLSKQKTCKQTLGFENDANFCGKLNVETTDVAQTSSEQPASQSVNNPAVALNYTPSAMPASGNCSDLELESTTKPNQGDAVGVTPELLKAEAKKLNKLGFTSVAGIIGRVINVLMAFIGSIALVLYIYSGILWMTAAGTAERIETSKRVIIWTTFGLAVMLGSYLIVAEVFSWLGL